MKLMRIAGSAASLALTIGLCGSADAAIVLTTTSYTQDFDTLASSGINQSALPAGWFISENGGGSRDNDLYSADTGSSNTGDTYSYGSAGSTDRALGSLASGTLESTYGAFFINNLGTTLTSISLDYSGEQWRYGGTPADGLAFQYSLDATSADNGTWIDFAPLDFDSVVNSGAVGALDGNAAANRVALGGTIAGLSIADGQTFGIRWLDTNSSGSDDGMAIDDVALSVTPESTGAVPEPASWALMLGGFGMIGGALRRRSARSALPARA